MIRVVSDTSTLYSTTQAMEAAFPMAYVEILPLSPAFITQGGPGCVAVQVIHN